MLHPRPRLLHAALVATAVVAACATNPVTGKRELTLMSEAQEIALGRESDVQIRAEMGVYEDAALQEFVSRIGLQLAKVSERPDLPWQFTVLDQPAVNAFALPGGFIYITRGILPFLHDEAELAGVLGHEIGHVTARHAVRQYTRAVGGTLVVGGLGVFVPATRPFGQISEHALGLLFLKYGRDDERQADGLGVSYAASGGWDPEGVPGMLATLHRLDEAAGDRKGVPNWLSTHPQPLQRIQDIQPAVQKLKSGRNDFVTGRDALLQRVDGLIFGDNPAQGIIRGNAFLHPPLHFRIEFPSGWDVANSPRQVVAKAPDADVFMLLQLVSKPQGTTAEEVAAASMRDAGFRPLEGERTTINGLEAYVGLYQGQVQGLGDVVSRAGHIRHDDAYYLVAGLVSSDVFPQFDATFRGSIRSFRSMSATETAAIRPHRVDVYVVRAGDTWASLAARSAGAVKPVSLAVMNHAAPDSQPPVKAPIKIVIAD